MTQRFIPAGLGFLTLMLVSLTSAARAQELPPLQIVGPGSTTAPIAIPALKDLGADADHRLSRSFVTTLRRDLKLSGYFNLIDPHAYVEDSQSSGYDVGQINFADWSSLNAEFLVKGAVSGDGSTIKITAMLFDVGQQQRLMGKQFSGAASDLPRMARRFADAVLKAVTGTEGPFDSRLGFVSTRGGRFKEIYTSYPDGGGLFRVTDNPTINLFPCFDHGVGELLYLSYKNGAPALYLVDLGRLTERAIHSARGAIIGGTLTPDGQSIVAAVEHNGATNLVLLDTQGGELKAFTKDGAINVSPAVSRDGAWLAFTSDRAGTPQLYLMAFSGGAPQRITYSGSYNTTPAFSPDGKYIAYQSRINGRFDIFLMKRDGGQPVQLTDGVGSNEAPSWSPDGRYIAFSSTRSGRSRIYLMQVSLTNPISGKIISALMEGEGDDTSPSWSWWLGR